MTPVPNPKIIVDRDQDAPKTATAAPAPVFYQTAMLLVPRALRRSTEAIRAIARRSDRDNDGVGCE